jgi:hypothetical protein
MHSRAVGERRVGSGDPNRVAVKIEGVTPNLPARNEGAERRRNGAQRVSAGWTFAH